MAIWQGYFLLPLVSIYIGWNIINWLINSHRFNSDSKINL